MSESFWFLLIAEVALLVGSAFFSSSETALFSLSMGELDELARSSRGKRTRDLLEDKRSLLVTILLGNLCVNILYFNLGTLLTLEVEGPLRFLVPVAILAGIIIFGEIIPKTLALPRRRGLSLLVTDPLIALSRLLWVPRRVLGAIAAALSRAVVGLEVHEGELTPEELESFVEIAYRDGCLEDEEVDWIQALLDLSEVNIKEFMVPRVAIVACPVDAGRDEFLAILAKHRRNKILVYEGSVDHIVGYVDAKEFLTRRDAELSEILHEVAHIPETAHAADAVEFLISGRAKIAVVVDEFGGTEGLLTRENLVEAVVGDLADEHDKSLGPVERAGGGALDVDARLGLSVLARMFGIRAREVATSVGGLLISKLGHLPSVGEGVEWKNLRLSVLSMQGRRIQRVLVEPAGRRGRRGITSRAFRVAFRRGGP